MESSTKPWLVVLIVAAFAVCAGFVAGAMLGLRERGMAKARNEELSRESVSLMQRLAEADGRNNELTDQLDRAKDEIDLCQNQKLRPEQDADEITSNNEDFHPPMVDDSGSTDAEQRLAELECEVAALRELVQQNAVLTGPPSPATSVTVPPANNSTMLAKASDPAPARQQCTAITKKGVRCSRPARSNGKCWQHGG